jgi:hypothetical protein
VYAIDYIKYRGIYGDANGPFLAEHEQEKYKQRDKIYDNLKAPNYDFGWVASPV